MDHAGVRSFISGGVSGMMFIFAGQPFDTIKVRMQEQVRGTLYKSNMDCLKKTVKYEGTRALFKGMSTPLAAAVPYSAVFFLGHHHGITLQQRYYQKQEMSVINHGVAGLLAGTYMTFIIAPGERVKCLLQLQRVGNNTYTGPIDVIRKTLHSGGIRQLFKGTFITGIRDVPGSGCFYLMNESVLRFFGEASNTPYAIMTAGGLGGIGMWLVGIIPDVIKTKYQTAPPWKYNSFLDVIPELYRQEGLQAFFKGFGPSGLRAFLANGLCICTYEFVMRSWGRISPLATIMENPMSY